MRKRRVLSMVLALVMLMSCCFNMTAAHVHAVTTTDPTIVVSDVKAEAGSTAAVSISLENNPGIVSMTLQVAYDTNILTLVEVKDAGVFGVTNHKPELQNPYTLAWENDTALTDFTVTGTIVTLFFDVSATAEKGATSTVEVSYNYEKNDILNAALDKVKFEIENGSVTVGEPEANAISDFTYTVSGTEMTITGYTGGARDVIIGSKYTVGGVEYTVVAIADEAFVENTDITSVVIPETVKYIGEAAFYDCTSLTEVTVLSEDAEIGEVALGYYYIKRNQDGVVEGFTIKGYPDSTAQVYADADDEITFVALEKECEHTGGTATCKDKAVCTKCGELYGELNPANHTGNNEIKNGSEASCNTPGYTGDTWCKDCNTQIGTGTATEPTGDHVDADGDWETNETHHFRTCTCTTVFDSATHTGGTATCKEKAVCSVCGVAYGSLNASNHVGTTYLVGQKEASCYEPGYTGDTYCSDCDTKIATGTTIGMDEHTPASVWSTDETHHWKECTVVGCGNLIDKASHTGGEATCKAKAVCSVCGVAYGSLNSDNHKNTEVRDAATAECNTPGYTGDTWCLDCNTKIATGTSIDPTGNHIDVDGRWESNETQHFHTCSCGTEFDKDNHTGGTATCKDKAVCSICGVSYGDKNATNHTGGTEVRDAVSEECNTPGYTGDTYCLGCNTKIATGTSIDPTGNHIDADGDWESNGTQHFHTCGCGTEFDKAGHTGGEATCKVPASCSVCGTAYGDLNADNHKGTTYLVGQKETSCYEPGYTGDTYCSDCNVKIATGTFIEVSDHNPASVWSTDDTHHWKECTVVACGNIIDKAEHTGGEATCAAKAVCSVCGVAYGSLNADNHKNTEVRDVATESCNTPGYTGDTWCLDCNTKIATGTTIDPTGNHIDADGDWESNGTQHFHTCGCGTEFDKVDHTGGTATCKDKAVCSVCGVSYGDKNATNHTGGTEVRGYNAASCNEPGYTGDTYCLGCNTKIADGTTINPTGNHVDADGDWESNGTQHFHTCGCGTEFDKAGHTGGEATCKVQASCSVCGTAYGDLNANNHIGTTYLVGQKETSCYEPGYTGDTYCSDCNVKIATGTSIEMSDHSPASVWSTDDTHHWKECTVVACGNIVDKAEHTGGEATCTAKAVCSVCNVPYGTINADNHKNTELRDVVAAECNTPGYTGDTWCLDCNTKIATGTATDPTGNHVDADGDWESNGTQHFHTCGCGTEFDKADHTGGTATCKDKAVCSVCGVSYGDKNATNHTGGTEVRGYNAASCNEPGYTGDTYCLGCNTKLQTGTAIDPTGNHVDADGDWESNGTQHFHTCGCGTEFDKAGHTGGEATCKVQASCSVCGTAYGELNANNHKGTTYLVGQKETSCYEPGYTGDTYCSDCNVKIATGTSIETSDHSPASVWSTDETHHWKECTVVACGNIVDKAEHTGGEATCTAKAVCSVCNVAYGSVNADNHKNTEVRDAATESCTTPGYTGDTWCKDCETKIATGTDIPAGHKTVKVPAAGATHEKDGNIEYFTCSGCELLFADEAATTVITIADTVVEKGEHSYGDSYEKDADNHWKACACGNIIEKTAHTFGDWKVTKEATNTEKGSKEKACSVCGYTVVEDIPVVEDKNDNTTDSPQTGDNSNLLLWIALLFVSGSGLTACVVSKKRTKQSR